jgi:hypothetical protein
MVQSPHQLQKPHCVYTMQHKSRRGGESIPLPTPLCQDEQVATPTLLPDMSEACPLPPERRAMLQVANPHLEAPGLLAVTKTAAPFRGGEGRRRKGGEEKERGGGGGRGGC